MEARESGKTIRLYETDSYRKEFEAVVESCTQEEDGSFAVALDQTAFFPEGGGQKADRGTLNGIEVKDVQIKDGVILHLLSDPIESGKTAHGILDFEYRFSNMQQHSGEHIFSGLTHHDHQYENVGFHLGDEDVTLDFNGVLTEEEALTIEKKANRVITENLPIRAYYPDREEADSLVYRSKIEIDTDLRLVEIPGVDLCACCAPHVGMTGEIGLLKVTAVKNYKGGSRIHIACGSRALQLFDEEHRILTETSDFLSTLFSEVPTSVRRLKEDLVTARAACHRYAGEALLRQIRELPSGETNVILFLEGAEKKAMQDGINLLMKDRSGVHILLCGNDSDGYQYIAGSADADILAFQKAFSGSFGAKGGGKAPMVQGTVSASQDDLKKWFEEAYS